MASPAEIRTVPWAVSVRPALRRWIDSAACSMAWASASSSSPAGGQHEAVGQAVEQPGADGVLERLDPPRHGGMADVEPRAPSP